jgi:DNA-binding NarL/FixJ family response regulator
LGQPRVLLADDHNVVLERVLSLLQQDFQVVGTVGNGRQLVSEALRLQPDVIVLDISMPVLTGIEAAHELREAGSKAKLVFLTVHDEPGFVDACLAEGGLGYVTKSRLRRDLIPAITEALSDRSFISPSVPK